MTLPLWFYIPTILLGVFLCIYIEESPASGTAGLWKHLMLNFKEVHAKVAVKFISFLVIFATGLWTSLDDLSTLCVNGVVVFGALFLAIKFGNAKWSQAAASSAAGVGALYLAWIAGLVINQ